MGGAPRADRQWGRRPTVVSAVPWLAAFGAIFLIGTMIALNGTPGWGFDFEAYYLAGMRVARGDALYLHQTLSGAFRPGPYGLYLYPAPLAIVVAPLTAFGLQAATVAWLALRMVLIAAACALMPVSRIVRLATFAVAAFSGAILSDLHLGNVSIIVAFLAVVAWRWLDRPLGSVALAAAMFLRPTMGLLLVWSALRRRWMAVGVMVLTAAVIVLATLPVVGLAAYADYLRVLLNVSDVTGVANGLDLGSAALRLGLGSTAAVIALFGGYAIAAVATVVAGRRRDREMGFVITLGATMLATPLLWDHYLALLLIPAAFLAGRGHPWALALPLLSWLPAPFVPLLVVVATLLPFIAERRPTAIREARQATIYAASPAAPVAPASTASIAS